MAYKKVYLEWTVGNNDLHYGLPVGFEVEFSRDKSFHEITTKFNTWDRNSPYGSYRFDYSLDDGQTWTQFPWGDQGKSFITIFRMRLEVTPSDMGYSLVIDGGIITKISADSKRAIGATQLNFDDIKDADQYGDILYLVTEDTIYKIDGKTLEPYKNALPLLTDNALGVVFDESRESFWQVNSDSVWLRSIYGDVLWTTSIPEVELDFSSSSSSSSFGYSSTSSSSSYEYFAEYCMYGATWEGSQNGTYIANGDVFNGKPVYFNGTWYMFYGFFTGTGMLWAVDEIVQDELAPNGHIPINGNMPDSEIWYDGFVSVGFCSSSSSIDSSSSSSSVSSSSSSSESSESVGNISSSSSSYSSLSSESYGNISSSSSEISSSSSSMGYSSTSSSSSEQSMGEGDNYLATGFDAFPIFQGKYFASETDAGAYPTPPEYIYHNDNHCILKYDTTGGLSTWKLYMNTLNMSQARDHYYITPSSINKTNQFSLHMWWSVEKPTTGLTGNLTVI